MKVTKLHIDEYKVFKDFDIDFTDGEGKAQNLIVLAGINGTGKTTLLNYIWFIISVKGLKFEIELGDSSIEIDNGGVRHQMKCDKRILDGMLIPYKHENIFFLKAQDFDFDYPNQEKSKNRDTQPEVEIVKTFIDKFIYDDQLSADIAYTNLRNFIDSIFPDFSLNFKFNRYSSQGNLYFKTHQGTEVEFKDLSSGERQLINLALRLFVSEIKDSIILIDEPEFSLHPSWQNKIVGVLQKYADEYNCQVILATHSPHIIGSVKPEQLRLLYKDDNGAIKVRQHVDGSYGWPVDRVLVGLMDMDGLRTPDAVKDLKELNELVRENLYDTDEFKTKMQQLEDAIGADDEYLTSIRFEIVKRRKDGVTNN